MRMDPSLEKELLSGAKRLDPKALAAIYDSYSTAIYAYSMRLLGEADLAEDCVAETFSRFLHALHAGKGPQDYLQAYLYRIAHNWITDSYRREPQPSFELDENLHAADQPTPAQSVDENLQQARMRAALHQLTPDQRQVIVLRFLEGWENEEVAVLLNKPIGAVKALQHRALEALRKILVFDEMNEG
jgi:RNA polymerase sigma-70 factor (ECF subfamily)